MGARSRKHPRVALLAVTYGTNIDRRMHNDTTTYFEDSSFIVYA